MKLDPPLQQATLLRRYKRFLADIETPSGEIFTIHCPNTGSMKNCWVENSPCWYSDSGNPKRKYRHTLEVTTTPEGALAGVNTGRANALVEEAIVGGTVVELAGYDKLRREVRYGDENSRIDLLLSGPEGECYVEVKNVTLAEGGRGLFPDAVSSRGAKHLRELQLLAGKGVRSVLFYCVQHTGIESVEAAAEIDPVYAEALKEAVAAGVEVLAYRAAISAEEIVLTDAIPFLC
ncbi:DNA/RNA nuclease SfsA [Microbulbifer thermotolerans]|uniref:Sugar fermentation stimulation protein homolog n=1 Tax=Microbulbifer thermotolerans TaxID=252514 RepID=A0AB35HYN6_MICTH|nr:DNA/RNA nuclease SfsA [Microbulbifer thermotolerans]MCX2779213.1 DNA/RNA nuclease SfsA [Microbulbifer thermotolerans]MCX2801573.1 DNA/RNA nuclease SfsA [Microbulbifer thermotolerans]MCX2803637.1 DNA/RNA nuclease SfsA [Microbulbifer thermotolerans]WKT61418.1 DNA/RNA nuclease SfsA [Microbulbifer thermotolerans]